MSTPAPEASLTIGALAARTGVSPRLLRYYEQQGLLAPARSANGYRRYAAADARTVQQIRTLLDSGLTTRLIAVILPCLQGDGGAIRATCPETRRRVADEGDRLRGLIAELQDSLQLLDRIAGA